ncbi:inositol 2-dehydrogenase-like isoform X2 [Physella acuta]|nr:inositol 2-dehydrogenase-like isoform X2 [Physella acuta]XP_059173072.1 inositol 2-dehydrogenase-like isoform X2 [Physella acuta]XP_059173073.1 inositol 2-dehydrogenase-like isoform X2 [Physella acuta]XP_059173074.1 inositol 2-dehydrogenase-like isoform X2 [Physella acuta]XP_059173075.1 inositol 2-dehydrogenase-like isoform X2 [Physella acuta]XP_059173077.1 inositol 2-dehydrogenase-like isoform X2 [Physella acuta]
MSKNAGVLQTNKEKDCPLTCIVIGAGSRGSGYALYAKLFPNEMEVVGVAEPNDSRRSELLKLGTITEDKIFKDWKEVVEFEKFADFVIIATVDQDHKEPAIAFAKLGYNILLEKPMAVTEKDCREIVETCKQKNVKLAVCHVLRYTAWVKKIKEIIMSGQIGDVANIRHTEPVGFWHFAHSFVRGNWRKEAESTFSLLSKSCHDVDLINYWMSPRKCVSISSFGKLTHFTKRDKPPRAGSRCLDCQIEQSCPYSAKKIYLDAFRQGRTGWPVKVISDVVDIEHITEALQTGPYGKCVYDTDNDVVSHQVVNFQFDNGATVCFNMVAFTQRLCAREVKIYGTRGEISFEDGWEHVQVFDFLTQQTTYHAVVSNHPNLMTGHGGADFHLMQSFLKTLRGETDNVTGPEETLSSHLLVFAAEKARLENKVVTIDPDGSF